MDVGFNFDLGEIEKFVNDKRRYIVIYLCAVKKKRIGEKIAVFFDSVYVDTERDPKA